MKKLLLALTLALTMFGTANAAHVDPVTKEALGHSTTGAQYFMAGVTALVFADAIATSNAQGVLPCHSKPDVLVDMGGYKGAKTDCEVNGFK